MKVSEVTINNLKDYLRIDLEEDDSIISIFLASAKSYIKSYTGLTEDKIDEFEDITMALLVLASELYENREYTVNKDKINPIVQSILDMHSINLL